MTSAIGGGYVTEGRDFSSAVSALPPEESNHVVMVKGRPFSRVKSEITQVRLLHHSN